MPRARVDVKRFPAGIKSAYVDWGLTPDGPWNRLGDAFAPVSFWDVPVKEDDEVVYLRARPREDRTNRIREPGRVASWRPHGALADRDAVSDITFPSPQAKQDGVVVRATLDVPTGENRRDYLIQVASSGTSEEAHEGVHVGFVDPGEEVVMDAMPETTTQKIHMRPIRKEDLDAGTWVTQEIDLMPVTHADTEDHDDDFTLGTLEAAAPGFVPLVDVGASGVEFNSGMSLDDLGSATLDDLENLTLCDLDNIPASGQWTSPVVELPELQPVQVQVHPEVDTITRASLSLDDLGSDELCLPFEETDGTRRDTLLRQLSFTLDGDRTPGVVETEIATSLTASPTFTDSDFEKRIPGKVYYCKAYALRVTLRSYFGTQWRFRRIRIRHHCVHIPCRSKAHKCLISQTSHGFSLGDVVYINGADSYAAARSNALGTLADGIVGPVVDANTFWLYTAGVLYWASHGLTAGTTYYLDPTTAGDLTTTAPSGGNYVQNVLVPINANEVLVNFSEGTAT